MSSTQQLLLGEGAGGGPANYIEDVFSTYLWTGNGTSQTITNSIDLSTKGGLVWIKRRDGVVNHYLATTNGGTSNYLNSNTTSDYETSVTTRITSFNTDGFSLGSAGSVNNSGSTFVGWTFRDQPKFFDIVTYTGNGSSTQTISHSLGSIPGCIIVKKTSGTSNWSVYHRSLTAGSYLKLNTTAAQEADSFMDGANAPTSTTFTAQLATSDGLNANGATYVAYLFAHDAGGFGLTGTDNVISCGTFTTDGSSNATVTLGYEPQWVLAKSTVGGPWYITDNMRGMSYTEGLFLQANSSATEGSGGAYMRPTATGFGLFSFGPASQPYIYIAIRRGPMKVPTDATKVFTPALGVATAPSMVSGFPVDMQIGYDRDTPTANNGMVYTRLTGNVQSLRTNTNGAEQTETERSQFQFMNGINTGNDTSDKVGWMFRRAPNFYDVVCYTGTGSNRTITHNLAAVPELMIAKKRSGNSGWLVYAAAMGNTKGMRLNSTQAEEVASDFWNNTTPTSTVFSLGNNGDVNENTATFVWYGFATCAGVSKVGSYTGNGSTQTINCGFTGGARFVLIKRTDSTGDWYTYDTTRGMTVLTDPYIWMNSTAVEVATLGSVTTVSTGFALNSAILAAININAGTYIFLAIA